MKRLTIVTAILLLLALTAWVGVRLLRTAPQDADEPSSFTSTIPTQTALPQGSPEPPTDPVTDTTETVILLHTNDFHGAVEPESAGTGGAEAGGLVNLISLIHEVRAKDPEHTIVLDAGDSFQGSYVSNSTFGEVVMAGMNIAGYDAWTLGNHEFDWGQEPLRARIAQAQFPALGANLLDVATGETWEPVQPYAIVQAGRARVGILGLVYPDTPAITRAGMVAGLDFRTALEAADRYIPELQRRTDLIVILSHLGYDGDRLLARAVEGVDVIVGGHSHVFLERADRVNGVLIVQAGAKGQVLGRLALTVDLTTGQVVDYDQDRVLLPVTNNLAEVNLEARALVDAAMAEAAETINQPIGETLRTLEPQRDGEFALGNLIVDAMLAADLSDGTEPDIAMHNNGGIRAALAQGPITYGQLYAVLPFDNQLIALDLSGAEILQILEHSIEGGSAKMQVAGMAFRYESSRSPGLRITEATVGGRPLEPDRVYRVVTIDYLAGGGDGQETFLEGRNPTYGDSAVWVVAEYIRANSPVDPQIEGRIQER